MLTFNSIKASVYKISSYGVVARILIFFKGILLAYFIGADHNMDTYLVAFSATLLLTNIIADGLIVSLVPTLQEIDKRDGLKGRNDFTNNMVNSFILFSLIMILLGFVIAPIVIKIMGPGFAGEEFKKAVSLFRLGLPIITFHFLRAIGGGYLQSIHKFGAGAKASVVNPAIYIIYLVTFGYKFGLEGLMIAGIIAVVGQAYVFYKACLVDGYEYKFYIFLKDRTTRRVFTFLLPVLVGIGINEVNAVVDNAVGSILEPGTIAHLTYANEIMGLIVGIFIYAIVTAIYPILAEAFNKDKTEALKKSINYSFRLLSLITIPVTIIFITMAGPIVKLFYERGAFGTINTINTAQILIRYSTGLIGTAFVLLLVRIFYALQDTNTPMIIAVIALGLNIILDIILGQLVGPVGIAGGTALSVLLASLFGIIRLEKKISFINWKDFRTLLKEIISASFVMLSVIYIIKVNFEQLLTSSFIGNLFLVTIVTIMGIVAFGIVIYAFNLKEKRYDY